MSKKMSRKISLILALLLLVSVVLAACGDKAKEKTIQDIKDSGKIVMGTDADYPPFEFHITIDGKDEVAGFDIEIAKYIAEELGVELEIKEMDFGNLIGGLSTGMIDFAIAGMNPDPTREANFTDVYYEANLAVLVVDGNPLGIKTEDDLKGKKIGVQIGTTQEAVAKKIEGAEVVPLDANPDIVMNLASNKIDCAIMESPVASSFAKSNKDVVVVEGLELDSGTDGVAIALKEGNDEITEKFNEILKKLKDQGLLEKWFAEADELSAQGAE